MRALQRACGYVIQKPPREAVGKQLVRFVKRWVRALKRRVTGTLDADVSIGSLLWALLAVGVAVLAVDKSWLNRGKAPAARAPTRSPWRRRPSTESTTSLQTHADAPTWTSRRVAAATGLGGAAAAAARVAAGPRAPRGRVAAKYNSSPTRAAAQRRRARASCGAADKRAAAEAVAVVETVSDPPTPERPEGELAALQALDARRLSPAALDASMELLPDRAQGGARSARTGSGRGAGRSASCASRTRGPWRSGAPPGSEACAPTVAACPLAGAVRAARPALCRRPFCPVSAVARSGGAWPIRS